MPVQNWAFNSHDSFDINNNTGGFSYQKWDSVNATANLKVGGGTFTDVIGYKNLLVHDYYDADGTIKNGFNAENFVPIKFFSEELRYATKITDIVDLITGLYYSWSNIQNYEARQLWLISASLTTATFAQNVTGTPCGDAQDGGVPRRVHRVERPDRGIGAQSWTRAGQFPDARRERTGDGGQPLRDGPDLGSVGRAILRLISRPCQRPTRVASIQLGARLCAIRQSINTNLAGR